MIRITKITDYAMVILTYVANQARDSVHTARDLASATGVPRPMVGKILKALARKGLLESHRGAKGGYSLSRAPEQLSLGSIVEALEGPMAVTECLEESISNCSIISVCPVRTNWQLINDAIRGTLEEISLADLAQPISFKARPLKKTAVVATAPGTENAQASGI